MAKTREEQEEYITQLISTKPMPDQFDDEGEFEECYNFWMSRTGRVIGRWMAMNPSWKPKEPEMCDECGAVLRDSTRSTDFAASVCKKEACRNARILDAFVIWPRESGGQK